MAIGFGPEAPAGSGHGTFDSFFDVFFDVRKGGLSGPIALSDTLRLTSQGVPWNHFPPTDALEITDVNSLLNGTDSDADFWPIGPFQEVHPTGAVHAVTSTTVPEPGSLSLLAIGVLAGVGRRILSRRRRAVSRRLR